MREGIYRHRTLLGIELFEISEDFMYGLRERHKSPEHVFKLLPKYTINTNEGQHNQIMVAEYFHQWVGLFKDNRTPEEKKKYLYFNIETLDATLREEISNAGEEDLLKNLDFKKILSNFTPQSDNDLSNFVFPYCNFLIVDLIYDTTYDNYNGGWDCDMEFEVIGYLNSQMQAIYFENSNNN